MAGDPPRDLARLLELPDGDVQPSFRLVHPKDGALGFNGFVCQHRTPDLIRRPDWLDHPHGARRIRAVTVAVPHPAALLPAYPRLPGPAAVHTLPDVTPDPLGALPSPFRPPRGGPA